METTLRTGKIVPDAIITTTIIHLKGLLRDGVAGAMMFYDIVTLARDPQYRVFPENLRNLKAHGLLDRNGRIHTDVREVILASVVGDGLDMKLRNPRGSGVENG